MTNHTPDTVGVDISKNHLDAHQLPSGRAARFANDAAGIEELAAWAGPDVDRFVYESTGPWHRAFEESLAGTRPLSRVNANRARRFAQALGEHAKTDAADARVLALMGAAFDLRRVTPPAPAQRDLDEMRTARDALVKDRTAALNRRKHVRHALLKRQNRHRLAQVDRQIQALDAAVAELIAADEGLARKAEVLASVPGIGPVTAAGLLAEMPELGAVGGKAAASLAGLAPVTRESGTWKGRGFIRGGRAGARRALYMAAVSAVRCNPDYVRKYRELRDRGKPPKPALVAGMGRDRLSAPAGAAGDADVSGPGRSEPRRAARVRGRPRRSPSPAAALGRSRPGTASPLGAGDRRRLADPGRERTYLKQHLKQQRLKHGYC